jgi:MiaB-like tRNA modifying enzyme
MKVYVETYGCSANQADGEMISGLLRKDGFNISQSPKESDINIINTCIVKSPTENKMRCRIKQLSKINKPLIIAGCMPKTERNVIEKISPNSSLIGPDSIEMISYLVKETLSGGKIIHTKKLKKPKICLPRVRKNPLIDICEISNGCLGNCSFCQVKFAKGKLFSYPVDLIMKEIKMGLKEGCKEVWITSQDCGCWGRDKNLTLPTLLKKISEINGKFLTRIGMMNPSHVKDIVDGLVDSYRSPKIFKSLHLPVQSGSDHVLKRMNRHYKISDFRKIIKKFRKEFPLITLSTDIIVGFPGETERDFRDTINLIKDIQADIVNISKFGARPGTKAKKMRQLPVNVINQRSKEISKIVKRIQLKKNEKWIGWRGRVLIDDIRDENFIGRNFAYKSVILKNGKLGVFKQVKIISTSSTSLFGRIL